MSTLDELLDSAAIIVVKNNEQLSEPPGMIATDNLIDRHKFLIGEVGGQGLNSLNESKGLLA